MAPRTVPVQASVYWRFRRPKPGPVCLVIGPSNCPLSLSLQPAPSSSPSTGAAASYIAAPTKSSTIGSASQILAGSTAGIDSTMELRCAPEHFSTLEQVAIYHWIMSEQFIVGQQVHVQHDIHPSEDQFPAAMHLQNPDGTYPIMYQDLDESNPTVSKKERRFQ
jgi:hypothetical protein